MTIINSDSADIEISRVGEFDKVLVSIKPHMPGSDETLLVLDGREPSYAAAQALVDSSNDRDVKWWSVLVTYPGNSPAVADAHSMVGPFATEDEADREAERILEKNARLDAEVMGMIHPAYASAAL